MAQRKLFPTTEFLIYNICDQCRGKGEVPTENGVEKCPKCGGNEKTPDMVTLKEISEFIRKHIEVETKREAANNRILGGPR